MLDTSMNCLVGLSRARAKTLIAENHYLGTVPSGMSYYFDYDDAIVVYSIPANKNISHFLLGYKGSTWELSRLWAPDNHRKNILTEAISISAKRLVGLVDVDCLVSYADPNAGHHGGVYKAGSWHCCGQSEEGRSYRSVNGGPTVSRRAFHSGSRGMTKHEIESQGYIQEKSPGKLRFARGMTRRARKALMTRFPSNA